MDIVVYWWNAGAGAGAVTFTPISDRLIVGQTRGADSTVHPAVSPTAGAQWEIEQTTIVSGYAIGDHDLYQLRLQRTGAGGSDTLGNAAGVLAVAFVKAS